MKLESKQVIGIDFGTTNSYFCKYLTETDGHKMRAIDFGHGQLGGIPSTILYRKDKDPIIGAVAEWYGAPFALGLTSGIAPMINLPKGSMPIQMTINPIMRLRMASSTTSIMMPLCMVPKQDWVMPAKRSATHDTQ